ncbi:MAG: citrate synthase/methylcitrate synthase [bacterium]
MSVVVGTRIDEILEIAKKKAFEETANEPEPKLTGEVKWPVSAEIGRGLENAVTNETKVGYVNGAKGWLNYRGIDIFNLSINSTFEETSYALLFGAMPTISQLEDFSQKLAANRSINPKIIEIMKQYPILDTHPMISLSIGVSLLSTFDKTTETLTVEAETEVAIKLIAQMATVAAAVARIRAGEEPIEPDSSLSHAANFLYMLNGKTPDKNAARVMDICLVLHADHGMNASTFAAMVCNSTRSDMYSSIVAGIGTLKGPLHGGANEQVLYQLEEIGTLENVEDWYKKAREEKRKVMGFGHRVYKSYDPRARILEPLVEVFTADDEISKLYKIANKLNVLVCEDLGKDKKIFPNVDFYSGLVYKAMGIEVQMFSVIFAVARISGWGGRVIEYLKDNRLFRPRAVYTGPMLAEYVPIEKR